MDRAASLPFTTEWTLIRTHDARAIGMAFRNGVVRCIRGENQRERGAYAVSKGIKI
jgi:hypothetical protein